jgi:hypothetical protein
MSADDCLNDLGTMNFSRKKLIRQNKVWRKRLKKFGIKSKITGVHAVSKVRSARVDDLYTSVTMHTNTGAEKTKKYEDVLCSALM